MKKIFSITLTVFLVLSLAACGGGNGSSDDPNLGVWKAVTGEMFGISMEAEDFFGKGFTIELKSGGKCALNVDGEKANGTWTLDNVAFTVKGGGIDCKGRMEDGQIILEDVMGMGMTLIFEKEGARRNLPTSTSGSSSTSEPTNTKDAGYYVINSITQDGETYDADDLKDFGISYYIVLNEDGTMELTTDNNIKGTWKPGLISYKENGEDVVSEYTLKNDILTIEIADGEITLVFKRSSGAPTAPGGSGNAGASGLSEKLAWWDGDWYGYWTIVSGDGRYESMKGGKWDCYATINAYDDNTATVFWYDDDMFLGEVYVDLDFEGYQIEIGFATSTGGTLFDDPVRDGAWYISPDNSDYDNMIQIDEWHEDLQGVSFRYKVFLRPWGMLWDDVPAGERPPDYDWYLGVRSKPMDGALGGVSSGGDIDYSYSPAGGMMVESEVKSPNGKTGTMYAALPDGWFDHSAPDLMSGFMQFSVLEDDPWADTCIQIRSSYLLTDSVEDSLMYDGESVAFSIDYTEWVGVEERDGLGYLEVVTGIGEGCYVSIYFQGMDSRDKVVGQVLESFKMKWK